MLCSRVKVFQLDESLVSCTLLRKLILMRKLLSVWIWLFISNGAVCLPGTSLFQASNEGSYNVASHIFIFFRNTLTSPPQAKHIRLVLTPTPLPLPHTPLEKKICSLNLPAQKSKWLTWLLTSLFILTCPEHFWILRYQYCTFVYFHSGSYRLRGGATESMWGYSMKP